MPASPRIGGPSGARGAAASMRQRRQNVAGHSGVSQRGVVQRGAGPSMVQSGMGPSVGQSGVGPSVGQAGVGQSGRAEQRQWTRAKTKHGEVAFPTQVRYDIVFLIRPLIII